MGYSFLNMLLVYGQQKSEGKKEGSVIVITNPEQAIGIKLSEAFLRRPHNMSSELFADLN